MLKKIIQILEKGLSYSKYTIMLYARPYKGIVKKEMALAKLVSQNVLQIGCGAIPFTALFIAQYSDCHITAIDKDPRAVKAAKRTIKKMGLSDKITVLKGDALNFKKTDHTIVFLALQAAPLKAIINHLTRPDIQFIARIPNVNYRHIYDALPPEIEIIDKTTYKMKAFDQSWLFKVKEDTL